MMPLNYRRMPWNGPTGTWRPLLLAGAAVCWTLGANQAVADVSQTPLLLGASNVPGNLALVPSVEWPTLLSIANTGNYSSGNTYLGYFDSAKCYTYDKTNEWFEPAGYATLRKCGGSKQWSGNFLNWAGTPTIDPFRSALTGGYRYRDEVGLTVLEKARHTGQSSAGNRTSSANVPQSEIVGATPAKSDWTNFYLRLSGLGVDMLFSTWNDKLGDDNASLAEQVAYDPTLTSPWDGDRLLKSYTPQNSNTLKTVYRLKLRVKVCVPSLLEANCKKYSDTNYKPEGLLQQYNENIRYSVFGYLNDEKQLRDGGVLRAGQKYIGPLKRERGVAGQMDNARTEWSKTTGILATNPNPDDATATQTAFGRTVSNSGVINYLNKFGQLTTNQHKSNDPVSELYYAAFRYFRNLGNVTAYSTPTPAHNPSPGGTTKDKWLDGFPVITSWEDPIQYACQKNVILGIGDTNTHADRNLPGATVTSLEPAVPAQVAADAANFNVATATTVVGTLEGVDTKATTAGQFGDCCSNNSAYIAGMAYHANTVDLRDDISGKQLLSTHWVDVRENGVLKGRAKNQYWLAAKYGGIKFPTDKDVEDYGDPYAPSKEIQPSWWTDGDQTEIGELRPRNFYVASDATKMVESLKTAFANISKEVSSTTAALSTNSTKLETDTVVFQSMLDSAKWSGDLLAKAVSSTGTVSTTPTWKAAQKLDALTNAQTADRVILTSTPPTADSTTGALVSTTGRTFLWDQLEATQQTALRATASGTPTTEAVGQDRLAFIRGDRSYERTDAAPNNPFRQRDSRLGDIANSDPQYIYKPNFGYSQLPESAGFTSAIKSAYTTFRSQSSYQNRPPLVVVGANDGMLHGFDASLGSTGGKELFAYVPNDLIDELHELTDPTYAHRYYVDGTPRIGDALVSGQWKTLLVGSSGAGGRSIFALDVSNPNSMSASSVLWEFTHPEMGYSLGRPSLVPLYNGKFGVIVTSGYDRPTTTTNGYVWLLDASNGSVIKRFDLPNSGDLGAPLAVDIDNDRVADRVYVADTLGKVWRLDITGTSASGWDAPSSLKSGGNITPLFLAKDASGVAQPITAPLDAAYTKDREIMLVFGTGSFYQTTDNEVPASPQVQSFYGIVDSGVQINGRSTLLEQEILREVTGTELNGRAVSENAMTDSHGGWYLDLLWKTARGGTGAKGERVISQAQLGGNRVTFSTLIPSANPCDAGGTSWIMSLDLATGSRLVYSYFDYNGDGSINEDDYIELGDGTKVPVSGVADPDEGAVKGTIGLNDQSTGKRYLCYASSASSTGSNGVTPVCIEVMGNNNDSNRLSWHEVRKNL
ncbi:pilus assembly protein [Pseudomonas sp. 9Ag]|uniref:pilus assembly protein n=1 Tax=Pseudomonas sp. 9Ag TaxID=2653167 RepID=UPI0012F3B3C3|nr:PilC/PilY family type IV pilus protein [Pseudomonas sp. 9Ag]VXC94184.1 Tfp pilus assembly protein tip-associatedadhesin PilY1 [Pseudomonas sp. 9Ag]